VFKTLWLILFAILLKAEVSFDLNLSKDKLYLGEPTIANFYLTYRQKEELKDISPPLIKMKSFRTKELESKKIDNYTWRYSYLITPLESGELQIPPFKIKLSFEDKNSYRYITHTFKSKAKRVLVKGVPNSLNIVGDLKMKIELNRKTNRANRPIYMDLIIKGVGNLEDLKGFDLNISNVAIYPSKAKVTTKYLGSNRYESIFKERFSFIAQDSFTIPSIKLKYFNIHTQIPEILQTKPIKVTIDNPQKMKRLLTNLSYLIIGLIVGVIGSIFLVRLKSGKRVKGELHKRVLRAKSKRELYNLLLPYSNNSDIKEILIKLEEDIYSKKDYKRVDKTVKKRVLDILKILS